MGEQKPPTSRNSANYPNGDNDLKRFGRQAIYFWNRGRKPRVCGIGRHSSAVDALSRWHPNAGRHNLRKELPNGAYRSRNHPYGSRLFCVRWCDHRRDDLRPREPSTLQDSYSRAGNLRGRLDDALRIVIEIWPEPALGFRNAPPFAPRIILDLIALDLAEPEIARLRMREIKAGDGRPAATWRSFP